MEFRALRRDGDVSFMLSRMKFLEGRGLRTFASVGVGGARSSSSSSWMRSDGADTAGVTRATSRRRGDFVADLFSRLRTQLGGSGICDSHIEDGSRACHPGVLQLAHTYVFARGLWGCSPSDLVKGISRLSISGKKFASWIIMAKTQAEQTPELPGKGTQNYIYTERCHS
jgi:hypothetical protein